MYVTGWRRNADSPGRPISDINHGKFQRLAVRRWLEHGTSRGGATYPVTSQRRGVRCKKCPIANPAVRPGGPYTPAHGSLRSTPVCALPHRRPCARVEFRLRARWRVGCRGTPCARRRRSPRRACTRRSRSNAAPPAGAPASGGAGRQRKSHRRGGTTPRRGAGGGSWGVWGACCLGRPLRLEGSRPEVRSGGRPDLGPKIGAKAGGWTRIGASGSHPKREEDEPDGAQPTWLSSAAQDHQAGFLAQICAGSTRPKFRTTPLRTLGRPSAIP